MSWQRAVRPRTAQHNATTEPEQHHESEQRTAQPRDGTERPLPNERGVTVLLRGGLWAPWHRPSRHSHPSKYGGIQRAQR